MMIDGNALKCHSSIANTEMLLSIIIVNYNGRVFLADCLKSISEHVQCSYEVIIVDNSSDDDSSEYLRNNHPAVKLVCNKENAGYSKANNIGAEMASGELLLLLNNDTHIETIITPALDAFEDPQLGVLGCMLTYGDGRCQFSMGYELSPLRIVLSWTGLGSLIRFANLFCRVDTDERHYQRRQADVAWVSGAFLMTRKHVWQSIGGLDERYFMYIEDVDYCKRVRMAGYRVGYTPDVKIVHYEGGGKEWIGSAALQHTMRSYLVYVANYYGKTTASTVGLVLGSVMAVRSCCYRCMTWVNDASVIREKEQAYMNAARILVGLERQ